MKLGCAKWTMPAVMMAMTAIATGTVARAQTCPTSPIYSPDFTSNQSCLALNGNASFQPQPQAPAGAATITAWSTSDGTVTFTANNSFAANEPVVLSGFANSTFFNTLVFPVVSASSTQFTIAYSGASGPSDTGVATPVNVLQITPNQGYMVGSAWNTVPQPVTGSFSTTFTFQLSDPYPGWPPADGFAFVIQNSPAGTSAIGLEGCGMGFGDDQLYGGNGGCTAATGGIPNSVAVAFKTYPDGSAYPDWNSVSIESNGLGANCVDTGAGGCTLAENDLNYDQPVITLGDGNIHAVTVTYATQPSASQTNCANSNGPTPCLDVILDGTDLFPQGVSFSMSSIGPSVTGTAYVGFTGATGSQVENNNILNWVFTPGGASQVGLVTDTGSTNFNSDGGFNPNNPNSGGSSFSAQTDNSSSYTLTTTEIPIANQAACDAMVQANPIFQSAYGGAQCFVYQNAVTAGVDQPVMFAVTCQGSGGECATAVAAFEASLGDEFPFIYPENLNLSPNDFPPDPFLGTTGVTGLPAIGFLKGAGPDPQNPCTPYPNNNPPLFQSNQVTDFTLNPDTSGGVHASSGGTNSCWVVTYQTPGELPTVSITAPAANGVYQLNQGGGSITTNFACNAVNNGSSAPAGPYLSVTSCTDQNGNPSGTGTFSTTTAGPNTFTADVTDSAQNTNSSTVTYYVDVAPAITSANSTSFTSGSNGTFTVTTTGYPAPTITESGSLPIGLNFVNNGDGTATLSGTATTGGVYPITITAQNGVGSPAMQSFTLTVTGGSPANLSTSAKLSGSAASGYTATITVSNNGGSTANNVMLTAATLGGHATTSSLPISLGAIAPGTSAITTVTFAGFGTDKAASTDSFAGTFTGGSFSSNARATLP